MRTIERKVDKTRAEWSVRKMMEFYNKKEYVLENAVQRGFVWNKDVVKMSEFIYSLIIERPIPPIYVAKSGKVYSAMDGKQRTTTIVEFLNDKFPLSGLDTLEIYDDETEDTEDVDINGLYFSELEECIQNAIKDSILTVIVINDPTDDEMCEYFYYLNNGMALNAITTSRAKAKSRNVITELGNHPLFKSALTTKAFEKFTNEDIVVKSYAMLHEENPSWDSKYIRTLMEQSEITDEDAQQMKEVFDRIMEMHDLIEDKKVAKRILVRTHMISIIPIVWKSLQDGLSSKQMADWFAKFFNGRKSTTISSVYNSYATSGSGKKDAIRKRVEELTKDYNECFRQFLSC